MRTLLRIIPIITMLLFAVHDAIQAYRDWIGWWSHRDLYHIKWAVIGTYAVLFYAAFSTYLILALRKALRRRGWGEST